MYKSKVSPEKRRASRGFHKCRDCGSVLPAAQISKRWLCPECARKRFIYSLQGSNDKAFYIYQRWFQRTNASLRERNLPEMAY